MPLINLYSPTIENSAKNAHNIPYDNIRVISDTKYL